VPWLRRLSAGLTLRKPGFDPNPVHVRFLRDKVALGHVLRFSLSVSFHQFCTLTFIRVLFLPEGQTEEALEPSKERCYSGSRATLDRKYFNFFVIFERLIGVHYYERTFLSARSLDELPLPVLRAVQPRQGVCRFSVGEYNVIVCCM
jgi:hypothetical protein